MHFSFSAVVSPVITKLSAAVSSFSLNSITSSIDENPLPYGVDSHCSDGSHIPFAAAELILRRLGAEFCRYSLVGGSLRWLAGKLGSRCSGSLSGSLSHRRTAAQSERQGGDGDDKGVSFHC